MSKLQRRLKLRQKTMPDKKIIRIFAIMLLLPMNLYLSGAGIINFTLTARAAEAESPTILAISEMDAVEAETGTFFNINGTDEMPEPASEEILIINETNTDNEEAFEETTDPKPEIFEQESIGKAETLPEDLPAINTEMELTETTAASVSNPELTTDKTDYTPTETATILGRFFNALQKYILKIFGGSADEGNYTETSVAMIADEAGAFAYQYQLDGVYRPIYSVTASDLDGALVAETSFTDAPAWGIEQCQNGGVGNDPEPCINNKSGDSGFSNWTSGAVNEQKAHWREGDFLTYRAVASGLASSSSAVQSFTFGFDTTKNGDPRHAIDYIGSFDATETTGAPTASNANGNNPCYDVFTGADAGACTPGSPHASHSLPNPALGNLTENYPLSCANGVFTGPYTAGEIKGWVGTGGTLEIVDVTYTPVDAGSNGCRAEFTIHFKYTGTSQKAVFAWGGHVAVNTAENAGGYWGEGNAVPGGSPYHMRMDSGTYPNGSIYNAGCTDLALSAGAIIQPGNITIIKHAVGGDDTFAYSGTLGLASLTTASGTAQQSFDLPPGSYTVTETDPALNPGAGWVFSSLVCEPTQSISGRTATINAVAGQAITCTYTNTKQGKIIVEKQTLPEGAAQTFEFTPSWGANFFLADNGQNDSGWLAPGAYNVSETVPAGWNLASAVCDNGDDPSQINLAAGETVVCTFTNAMNQGQLKIIKNTIGDNGTFNFAVSGPTLLSPAITTAGNIGSSGPTMVAAGNYAITETVPTGWNFDSAVCDKDYSAGVNGVTGVSVLAGETTTCTFTNSKKGKIIVEKQTLPDCAAQAFEFNPSWGANFFLADNGQNDSGWLVPGDYSVSEIVPTGWALDRAYCAIAGIPSAYPYTPGSTIALGAGNVITCTFVNGKLPTLELRKTVVNNYGGTATIADFQGKINNNNVPWAVPQILSPGAYTASETALAGYSASLWGGNCANNGAVELAYGDNKICTITNSDIQPKLTVVKVVENNYNGTATVSDFALYVNATPVISGVQNGFNAGAYTVAEGAVPSGYEMIGITGDCAADGTITLFVGDEKTCTITNRDLPGRIKIVKDAVPNDLRDFEFTMTGKDNFFLDDDNGVAGIGENGDIDRENSKTFVVVAGAYTVAEILPNEYWQLSGITCNQGADVNIDLKNRAVAINAVNGEEVICTFVNQKESMLVTRTQGFWQNHTEFASQIFALPEMQKYIGAFPHKGDISNTLANGQSQLFGAYFANLAMKSSGKGKTAQRTETDKARMRLLQQLLTAKLNVAAFGGNATILSLINNADAAYASGNISHMNIYAGMLDDYNKSGDTAMPDAYTFGNATPQQSRAYADIGFWDNP